MLKVLFLTVMLLFVSCSCNKSVKAETDDKDTVAIMDADTHEGFTGDDELGEDHDEVKDEDLHGPVSDEEKDEKEPVPDEDRPQTGCPYPKDAGFPYFRADGTIHFCRECDTPDEYDPQCVKSLWKDLNAEIYEMYKNEVFENNDWIQECHPYPCDWALKPRTKETEQIFLHECDLMINPRSWSHRFRAADRGGRMKDGKIIFWTYNYRIGDQKTYVSDGSYDGRRAVLYDIETGKYTVLGMSRDPIDMGDKYMIINPYFVKDRIGHAFLVAVEPYKSSYRYSVMYHNETNNVSLGHPPAITEKWTVLSVNYPSEIGGDPNERTNALIYSKTGEWNWKVLVEGGYTQRSGEISVSGDKLIFYHIFSKTAWLCDLEQSPSKLQDCKQLEREGEYIGFPKFDRNDPGKIIYRSMAEDNAKYNPQKKNNLFVITDTTAEPWKVEKELEIPQTEGSYPDIMLAEKRGDTLLYLEAFVQKFDGDWLTDQKLCFYRMDKNKTYCSKPIDNDRGKLFNHWWSDWDGKYLFWQSTNDIGYKLRDMECYCEKEGVCPFED